jgi:hypothetical protein
VRSTVERSDTAHSEASTERAPAYWNARVRPSSPSPANDFPDPLSHDEVRVDADARVDLPGLQETILAAGARL